jgi:hypothetical protein
MKTFKAKLYLESSYALIGNPRGETEEVLVKVDFVTVIENFPSHLLGSKEVQAYDVLITFVSKEENE